MESCNCPDCVSACRNDPGRLIPDDLKKISMSLNVTIDELINDYLVKIPLKKDNKVLALAPAKRKGKRFACEPGRVVPDWYATERGECIFLEENLCKIHDSKPYECGAYMGCKNTFLGRPYRENKVEESFFKRWRSFKHTTPSE